MRILDCLAARSREPGIDAAFSSELVPAEGSSQERVGLAAAEMRAPALALLGHAQGLLTNRLTAHPADIAQRAEALTAIATRILDLADALEEDAAAARQGRVLAPEALRLDALTRAAVAGVSAALTPGRRLFRIAPGLAEIGLEADRRALGQVLYRVLASAARNTRDGDWIDIAPEFRPAAFALVVADEGSGLSGSRGGLADRRGLGLGLSLARAFMEAHGGSLAVESLARVGTRVTLFFPRTLLLGGALKPAV